jgi:hypothetical protein
LKLRQGSITWRISRQPCPHLNWALSNTRRLIYGPTDPLRTIKNSTTMPLASPNRRHMRTSNRRVRPTPTQQLSQLEATPQKHEHIDSRGASERYVWWLARQAVLVNPRRPVCSENYGETIADCCLIPTSPAGIPENRSKFESAPAGIR